MKFLLFTALLSTAAYADSTIEVTGKCEIKVTPDQGSILFSIENTEKDQKQAVAKTTAQANKFKEALSKLKLDKYEIKTSFYNVTQVREYENNKYVTKGMKAAMGLEIQTSDIPRLGETMTLASSHGINNIGSLNTGLSLEKSQQEYLKCLDIAAQDALIKAQALGKKLGFKVGKVEKLIESPATESSRPFPVMKSAMALSSAENVSVEAGTQSFSTQIQVSFEIK